MQIGNNDVTTNTQTIQKSLFDSAGDRARKLSDGDTMKTDGNSARPQIKSKQDAMRKIIDTDIE